MLKFARVQVGASDEATRQVLLPSWLVCEPLEKVLPNGHGRYIMLMPSTALCPPDVFVRRARTGVAAPAGVPNCDLYECQLAFRAHGKRRRARQDERLSPAGRGAARRHSPSAETPTVS
jgi:hypothetical protein